MSLPIRLALCLRTAALGTAVAAAAAPEPPLSLDRAPGRWIEQCIRATGSRAEKYVHVRHAETAPAPVPTEAERERGYLLFSRHWMDLVFPDSVPRPDEAVTGLQARAARDEFEPVSFSLHALRPLQGLSVSVAPPRAAAGMQLPMPDLRIVRDAPQLAAGSTDLGRGPLYPDGPVGIMALPSYLERPRPAAVPAATTVQYWITVRVPADARPGRYGSRIRIRHQDAPATALPLIVEVLPIRLAGPGLTVGFYDFREPYPGTIGSVGDVYATMRRYGTNAVFTDVGLWRHPPNGGPGFDFSQQLQVTDDGAIRLTLDGSPLATRLAAARDAGFETVGYHPRFGFRGGFIGRVAQDSVNRRILENETRRNLDAALAGYADGPDTVRIRSEFAHVAQRYFPVLSDTYARLYTALLGDVIAAAKQRGWPTLLVSPGDERFSHHRKKCQRGETGTALPLAVWELELMQRAGATTIMLQLSPFMEQREWHWFGGYARTAARFVDIGMPILRPSYTVLDGPLDEAAQRVADGLRDWGVTPYTYNLTIFRMPDLGAARFHAGYVFRTLAHGFAGFFDWVFYGPEGDPYNPLDGYDFLWYYPPDPERNRLGGPSLWLQARREGVDDLRYLRTLDRLIDAARAGTDREQAAARTAAALRQRLLDSFDFSTFLHEERLMNCRSRWDATSAEPGQPPTVSGSLRFPNGWDFQTYDRRRAEVAAAIVELQAALRSPEPAAQR